MIDIQSIGQSALLDVFHVTHNPSLPAPAAVRRASGRATRPRIVLSLHIFSLFKELNIFCVGHENRVAGTLFDT